MNTHSPTFDPLLKVNLPSGGRTSSNLPSVRTTLAFRDILILGLFSSFLSLYKRKLTPDFLDRDNPFYIRLNYYGKFYQWSLIQSRQRQTSHNNLSEKKDDLPLLLFRQPSDQFS